MIEDSFWLTLLVIALTFVVLWLIHELMVIRGSEQLSFADMEYTHQDDFVEPDDLTVIEGIGPKIAKLLVDSGYESFAEVAAASAEELKGVLVEGGSRFEMHDPNSWPKQARIADDGEWDRLARLQKKLKGGR